mgnify:CR=1 FL=1
MSRGLGDVYKRQLSAAFGVIFIFFNKRIGIMVYLFIGSAIETFIATAGVGFVLVLVVVIMLLPVLAVFRWLVH